ncbi:hypothetical protein [Novosphingobium sp.]|uniref:hypothetical protein n=1 Tax=Novosphingobium sp. TaxID=1874826 RepID=UPI002615FB98|nr:hypothetical protein [Novosphingobium sp.]
MMISAAHIQRAFVVILNSFSFAGHSAQDPSLPARRAITVALERAQRAAARPVPKAPWILKQVQDDGNRAGWHRAAPLEGTR